ncbi:hypothetical protein BSKO_02217 [Bryopsis sp. KO-2023]|nr:hypothetical protein BSKO_02217 [Bryopsis sp. KO-2023]
MTPTRTKRTREASSTPRRKRNGGEAGHDEGNKKKRKEKAAPQEKRVGPTGRTVRWAPFPNEQISQRIERALPGSAHRMFLLERRRILAVGSEGGGIEEFDVLGATANVYTVTVSRHPSCTCPDFERRQLPCKHILFVRLRVLKLKPSDPMVWQKAYLSTEVDDILRGEGDVETLGTDVVANDRVIKAYQKLRDPGDADNEEEEKGKEEDPSSNRQKIEGRDCGICFDDFDKDSKEALVWCLHCGNNLHKSCFERWASTKKGNHQQVTCVYCRSAWQDGDNPNGNVDLKEEGSGQYVNLGNVSGQHSTEQTSVRALYGDSPFGMGRYGRRRRRSDFDDFDDLE